MSFLHFCYIVKLLYNKKINELVNDHDQLPCRLVRSLTPFTIIQVACGQNHVIALANGKWYEMDGCT